MSSLSFNYIVTIHNKQDLLEKVLNAITQSMGAQSRLIPVLDGCSDNSEAIVDALIQSNPEKKIHKVITPDVHELRAINAGLLAGDQTGEGFNVVLQDDVVLQNTSLENTLTLLENFDKKLGVISLRHGANISRKQLKKTITELPFSGYIENIFGHNPNPWRFLTEGKFIYREIAIKSPIAIPFRVVREVGIPDEKYAPWDDMAYSYRISQSGYNNGILAVRFESKKEWGTTRQKKQAINNQQVHKRNLSLFKEDFIESIENSGLRDIYKENKIFKITPASASGKSFVLLDYVRGLKKIAKERLRDFAFYSGR